MQQLFGYSLSVVINVVLRLIKLVEKRIKEKVVGIVLPLYRKVMFDTALSRVYKLGCASSLFGGIHQVKDFKVKACP